MLVNQVVISMPRRLQMVVVAALFVIPFCVFAPANGWTPENNVVGTTMCSPSPRFSDFKAYNNSVNQKEFRICAALFDDRIGATWEKADQLCKRRYSFLLDIDPEYYNSSDLQDFLTSRAVSDPKQVSISGLIWIGIRKIAGFYSWVTFTPRIFRLKSYPSWGNKWSSENEPIHDCVALNIKTGDLETRPCSLSLPYMCMNQGLSTVPMTTPLCPPEWKFTYVLDSERGSSCFRRFERKKYSDALQECGRQNGSLINRDDYHNLFRILKEHYVRADITAYWVDQGKVRPKDLCTIRAKTAPPSKMTWKTMTCDDQLPFVCKRAVSEINEVQAWISTRGVDPRPTFAKGSDSMILTCKVNISGEVISLSNYSVHYLWSKNAIPVASSRSFISPMLTLDHTKLFAEPVSRQGSFRCMILIPGHRDYISSEEYDVFFSDVSSYILIFNGPNIVYSVSQDFTRDEFYFTEQYIREIAGGIVNNTENTFSSIHWDFGGINKEGVDVTLKILMFITWNETTGNKRPENEKENVYDRLSEAVSNYKDVFEVYNGITEKLLSADTCFEERMNHSSGKDILWPEAQGTADVASVPPCFDARGQMITRTCKASFNGAHFLPLPDSFPCYEDPRKSYCPEGTTKSNSGRIPDLFWPKTRIGAFALPRPMCLTASREPVVRHCLKDPDGYAYWETYGSCTEYQLSNLTVNLKNLSEAKIDIGNALESSRILRNLTSSVQTLEPVDLHYVASTMENIANSAPTDEQVIESVVDAFDNIMSMRPPTVHEMQRRVNSSSRITDSMERLLTETAVDNQNGNLRLIRKTLVLEKWNLAQKSTSVPTGIMESSSDGKQVINTLFNGSSISPRKKQTGIVLPVDLVVRYAYSESDSTVEASLNFIIYKNSCLFENTESKDMLKANSFVIHASLGNKKIQNQKPPITMVFTPLNVSKNITCGFWDQSLNDNFGGWSTHGCNFSLQNGSFLCMCNHLTNFALLMDLDPRYSISEEHKFALQIITYVGCGLSIFGLTMTVLTFVLFRKWRKGNKHQTLFNLSIALISTLVTFLVGIDRTQPKIGCMIVAVLLHYFLLASFGWMLVETVIQYLNFVKVLSTYIPGFMRKSMICAWGFPLSVVIVVLIVDYGVYGEHKDYCWISYTAFFYSLALPVALLLATNVVVFCLIIYTISCGRQKGLRCHSDERRQALMRLRASICMFFLLGLSWTFGLLALGKAKLVFQYLFSVSTSLQGFLIFVFCVIQEKTARDMWKNFLFPSSGHLGKSHATHSSGNLTLSHPVSNGRL